ncbi:permease [Acetobacterium woodii]|uniref:Putative membrane protein containing a ferredoxin domain n=1 Tax=Acetobacterium woodii (strain ATCC 29683 / DSM 1030 / JCM 2381 / KCTC 1655 / WB1) TaxID=931626 RepID=H6LKP5_ACEWD|nr:permease [Acetobacterium woodii]AFA48837.1 putative membrane protein containing a ferredoxin domain [Acetobacterium woodii DSM 1030]
MKIQTIVKNNKFLVLVLVAYAVVAILLPNKFFQSLGNTWYYLKEMLMIMPVILLLTSLITAWVPRKTIENAFGSHAGIKGSIFAFLLGSFSAGPIYAAFPVCKMLLNKGASIANVVIILSTWAVIKIPMLITENKFLGPEFMIFRWILTTIAIFLMGFITAKLVKPRDVPNDALDGSLLKEEALTLEPDYCLGCGICTKVAPHHFRLVNKKAEVISQVIANDELLDIKNAIEKCPAAIIHFYDQH